MLEREFWLIVQASWTFPERVVLVELADLMVDIPEYES